MAGSISGSENRGPSTASFGIGVAGTLTALTGGGMAASALVRTENWQSSAPRATLDMWSRILPDKLPATGGPEAAFAAVRDAYGGGDRLVGVNVGRMITGDYAHTKYVADGVVGSTAQATRESAVDVLRAANQSGVVVRAGDHFVPVAASQLEGLLGSVPASDIHPVDDSIVAAFNQRHFSAGDAFGHRPTPLELTLGEPMRDVVARHADHAALLDAHTATRLKVGGAIFVAGLAASLGAAYFGTRTGE